MEKDELEKTYGEILEEWRGEKVILENLNAITVDLEKEYQEKINLESSIIDEWADKNQQAADIEKEIKDQEEKLSRAEKHLKRLIREIRGTTLPKFQTAGEVKNYLRLGGYPSSVHFNLFSLLQPTERYRIARINGTKRIWTSTTG